MDRADVSQTVAMKVTGHRTDNVYRRYNIVDEADAERALTVTQQENRTAPISGIVDMDAARNSAQRQPDADRQHNSRSIQGGDRGRPLGSCCFIGGLDGT